MKPKIIFMGTPDFAIPSLKLIYEKYGIEAVVTQPDKPKGRGRQIAFTPVKEIAIELGIPVLQPNSLKDTDFIENIKSYNPDIIVVIAFRILPKEVYSLAKIASFNIHGSILPKYRGAAPINWAIINGEKETGLTSFVLKEIVDTGDILLNRKISIFENDNFGDIYKKLSELAPELAIETIEMLLSGNFKQIPQNDEVATPAPKIFKDDCHINFNKKSIEIVNFVRGLAPHPTAFTVINNENFKIFKVLAKSDLKLGIGEFLIDNKHFYIGCQDGAIEIIELQAPGKKPIMAIDFIRGYRGELTGKCT